MLSLLRQPASGNYLPTAISRWRRALAAVGKGLAAVGHRPVLERAAAVVQGLEEAGARAVGQAAGGGTSASPVGGYQVKPRYPESARRRGIEGTALLKMRITAQGSVADVQLERSAGHPELDESAMEAVRRWRFNPARRDGEPVAVWVLIPVEFKLQ